MTRDPLQPTLDGGSVWIDLRGIQAGTHSLVLDGRGSALRVDEEADRVLRGFRLDGWVSFDGEDYRVRGSLSGTLETACDRCLARFGRNVRAEVEVCAVPQDSARRAGEEIEEGAIVLDSHRRLNLAVPLRQAVLLDVPMKNVCRDDCEGLCPECGANRNVNPCACRKKEGDPRWESLRGLSFPPEEKE